MKKVLFLLAFLLWTLQASAQFVPEWHQGDLKKKGTVMALQGVKLDMETTQAILNQVGGPEMVAAWDKYRKERGWGIGLTSGGYTLAVAGFCYGGIYLIAGAVGTIFAAIGGQEAVDKMWSDLGPRVSIGGAAMLTGPLRGQRPYEKAGPDLRRGRSRSSSRRRTHLRPHPLRPGPRPALLRIF